MDVDIEKDDLNQKLLTSLAPEWLIHTIVWRNRNDLDTMSLDDLYNHLKIKFEDTNQIDEDDMEEMDIKWNIALLSIRADKFWKELERRLAYKDQIWQALKNLKLSASIVTRWVTSQESAEH
uniref:Uncharacterized protein n=1 Tax=Tanacetum cinerariifolium TaxID=118510 RepID=A0A699VCK6_TANCI|nr:hypothetical protein [Tanacetum cinerariifolium]